MKIGKTELERYLESYEEYIKELNDDNLGVGINKEKWRTNKSYLEDNGLYDILDIIEALSNYTLEQIVKALEMLEVEVV